MFRLPRRRIPRKEHFRKSTPSFVYRPSKAERVFAIALMSLLAAYDILAPILYFAWFSDYLNGVLLVDFLIFTVPFTVIAGLLAYCSCVKHLTLRDGVLTYRKPFKSPVSVEMERVARVELWLYWSNSPVVFFDLCGQELLRVYDLGLRSHKPFRRALNQMKIPFVEKEAK